MSETKHNTRLARAEEEHAASIETLGAEIERLTDANRASRSSDVDRQLLRLRHLAGIRLVDQDRSGPEHPSPDYDRVPDGPGPPEIAPDDLTPEILRAGILRAGCVLVRGLLSRADALRFAAQIDRAFGERDQRAHGSGSEHYYDEFEPDARFPVPNRGWIQEGGGVLALDSPRLSFELLELFAEIGLLQLVRAYLGEPALVSLNKTTLRKAEPSVPGAWHQDGAFMGDVNTVNLWLSLSRCGDVAPGLDIIPRRFEELVQTGTEGAWLPTQVSQQKAEEAAGDVPIIRPIFEPGDALLFDELFLHKTGSDPSMSNPRFAIETWFFGSSGFPRQYAPFAV